MKRSTSSISRQVYFLHKVRSDMIRQMKSEPMLGPRHRKVQPIAEHGDSSQ
jgi:hypothetical protein